MTGWKIPIFNRKYIFKWWIFHCHVGLRGGTFVSKTYSTFFVYLKGGDEMNDIQTCFLLMNQSMHNLFYIYHYIYLNEKKPGIAIIALCFGPRTELPFTDRAMYFGPRVTVCLMSRLILITQDEMDVWESVCNEWNFKWYIFSPIKNAGTYGLHFFFLVSTISIHFVGGFAVWLEIIHASLPRSLFVVGCRWVAATGRIIQKGEMIFFSRSPSWITAWFDNLLWWSSKPLVRQVRQTAPRWALLIPGTGSTETSWEVSVYA